MATTFKVPASPKKDVFEIDEFLGVDLTNNGTNVEPFRSPNAPNMVRNVPGKVRKRTGFKDRVVFAPYSNVNRNLALHTSDEWQTFEINGTNTKDATLLYEFTKELDATNHSECIRFEVDNDTENTIIVIMLVSDGNNRFWRIPPHEHRVRHSYRKNYFSGTTSQIRAYIEEGTDPKKYLSIKGMFVVQETDAEDLDEWLEVPWTPAPEDSGAIYVNTKTDPIYGHHSLVTTGKKSNPVVNVNRAYNTSSTWTTFNLTDSWISDYDFFPVEREFYLNKNITVFYEFDYIVDKDAVVVVGNHYENLTPTATEVHVSGSFLYQGTILNVPLILFAKAKNTGDTATLQIKNLAVMFDKDNNYAWDKTPEEKGLSFPTSLIVNENSKVYGSQEFFQRTSIEAPGVEAYAWDVASIDPSAYAEELLVIRGQIIAETTYSGTKPYKLSVIVTNYSGDQETLWRGNELSSSEVSFVCNPSFMKNKTGFKVAVYYVGEPGITMDLSLLVKDLVVVGASYKKDFNNYPETDIYHVGNRLFASHGKEFREVYSNMAYARSKSWQIGENTYILDGKNFVRCKNDGNAEEIFTDKIGTIPRITISKNPNGSGGTSLSALNLIQPGFEEDFLCQNTTYKDSETAVQFYLSFGLLDYTTVKAYVMDQNGNFVEKIEGVDFTVNRKIGLVQFNTAPGRTPVTGTDNVRIIAYRTVKGYADRIRNCTTGIQFGVNGATDRLFLSGNPDYPNQDWYSEQYDPTYFPDTGYSRLGSEVSAIKGYAVINNYLATVKDENEPSQSIFIREGDLVTDESTKISTPQFKLINTLQGIGAIARDSFAYLQTEPLFLTRSGIYAVTAQDITGEKYTQNRSFYLNGELTRELDLENAMAVVFNDMYVLSINNKLYILDGLQPTRTDRSEPYATRQYAAFYCTDIPANCIWVDKQALWFGTTDGRVCRFDTDIEALESYNDNGKAIYCCWETPDIDGHLFYKNKSFRYIAIRMMSALKTSLKLWAMARGSWSFIKEDTASGIFFDFENIDFESFTFSTDRTDKVAHSKIRVKKVDKARFKIENGNLNEPFGLVNLALEYVESGNYKG